MTSTTRTAGSRCRDDRGLAGAEILPAAVVVFVFGTLMLTNLWSVIDAKTRVAAAAREATRAYVEAPDAAAATTDARAAAADTLGPTRTPAASMRLPTTFARCAPATSTVTLAVPVMRIPGTGRGLTTITVTATHTELVDPWRTGTDPTTTDPTTTDEPCA
jgi:hypothetical protein